ncbi:hypothetical protein MUP00_08870 [Candidatus Bathyarchaeota archaeon]|nr:hypothetical protein [Candidatus Bathyarchaeota archaeon]
MTFKKRPTAEDLKKNHPVIQQIMTLSSGTMASLTGERDMKTLDLIQQNFYLFTLAALLDQRKVESWQEAWEYYATYPESLSKWEKT